MKHISIVIAMALALASCGYTARDGEAIGQAKKTTHATPVFCPNYVAFDLSLGVLRSGVGSMSTQDMWFTVGPGVDLSILSRAVSAGAIVEVTYDTRRVAICTEMHILRSIKIVE